MSQLNLPLSESYLSFPKVDLSRVQELNSLDPTGDLFRQLVEIFTKESTDRLIDMRAAYNDNQHTKLNQSAHRFRSTCYNATAVRMGEIAKSIELIAEREQFDRSEVNLLLSYLESERDPTLAELKKVAAESPL